LYVAVFLLCIVKLQILSSLGMLFHRPYSIGSLWLFSLKRQKVNISLSSMILNTADLGDEFHYLLKCDYFSEKRKTYIDKKYFKNCNILKFGTLMRWIRQKRETVLIFACQVCWNWSWRQKMFPRHVYRRTVVSVIEQTNNACCLIWIWKLFQYPRR
jgi:hypothetical protein